MAEKQPALLGDMAAVIAVVGAIIDSLPESQREEVFRRIKSNGEALIAEMLTDAGPDSEEQRERAEGLLQSFLAKGQP